MPTCTIFPNTKCSCCKVFQFTDSIDAHVEVLAEERIIHEEVEAMIESLTLLGFAVVRKDLQ